MKLYEIVGEAYIGNTATAKEPELTEFAKVAIEPKWKYIGIWKSPRKTQHGKKLPKLIKNTYKSANWIGDESQKQDKV